MAATGKKVQTGQTKKKSTSAAGQKRTASQGKRKTTAGKSTARAKTSKRSNSKKKQDKIEAYVWKDIGLIICLVFSVLLFVSCFERFGPYLSWLKQINFGIFGYIGYITPFILAGLSLYFIVSAKKVHPQLKILGWILSLCGLCGLSRLWFQVENERRLDWTEIIRRLVFPSGSGGNVSYHGGGCSHRPCAGDRVVHHGIFRERFPQSHRGGEGKRKAPQRNV